MATSKSRKKARRAKPESASDGVEQQRMALDRELKQIKCSLICASHTLSQAQDNEDAGLGIQAWISINECAERLERFENSLDSFWTHSTVTSREVAHGQG